MAFGLAGSVNPWLILVTVITVGAGIVMSVLVSLKPEFYHPNGLDGFEPIAKFTLGNALAMMWLSQLAYEAEDHPETVAAVQPKFKLTNVKLGDRAQGERKASYIVAARTDATFVMFAGTDPLKLQDLITDADLDPLSTDDRHQGFLDAVKLVQPDVEKAIADIGVAGKPLFFTGHSLGGALAQISAQLALKSGLRATAVYTFGGARAGGPDFFASYDPALGNCTYRLVHGKDIVAKVPPSFGKKYRHVGQFLHCDRGSTFTDGPLAPRTGNAPDLTLLDIPAVLGLLLRIPAILAELIGSDLDSRKFDQLKKLPDEIRDHVPASYFRALGMPLAPP